MGKAQLRPVKTKSEEQDPGLHADLLATLLAARWPNEKILRLTAITAEELESFRRSPLLRALQARDSPRSHAEDCEDLWPDVKATWQAAMQQRDDDMNAALRAADAVAARVHPVKQAGSVEPVIHIHLDAKERATIERVLKEDERTIDVKPLLTLDQAIEKYADGHDS